jgi:hypothetical protein
MSPKRLTKQLQPTAGPGAMTAHNTLMKSARVRIGADSISFQMRFQSVAFGTANRTQSATQSFAAVHMML